MYGNEIKTTVEIGVQCLTSAYIHRTPTITE